VAPVDQRPGAPSLPERVGQLPAPVERLAGFVGWFGPIGITAIFYAILAMNETGVELVWTAVSLVVAGSVLVHGMTSTYGTHWYGRLDDDTR
jgi:NhaP-type Na+/H+ or K+/H+ antiporter